MTINSLSGSFEIYNENDPDPDGDLLHNIIKIKFHTQLHQKVQMDLFLESH